MEVLHWLANLPVRRYRRPPPGGYLVQWPPRHSCSQRSDDVDPVYWGLLYKLIWEDAERGKCVGPCSCTASVHSYQWRQAEWLDLHVSLNVMVLNSLYACFWVWCSGQTTVSYGKSFCGCFCLGSCPFLCVWFAVSFDETQVWLGDLRVVWLVCVMVGLLWFACISGPFRSLYKWCIYCLCSCKDRASVRHRPYSRKKKRVVIILGEMNGFRLPVHPGCTVYAVHSWWNWMVSVPTSLSEWIHSPWFDLGLVVWKGYRPRVRLVLAGGHASAWFSPFWRGPAPGAQRYQAVLSLGDQPWKVCEQSAIPASGPLCSRSHAAAKRAGSWLP